MPSVGEADDVAILFCNRFQGRWLRGTEFIILSVQRTCRH